MVAVKRKPPAAKEYVALKNLATSKEQVKAGQPFTCTEEEYEHFKKVKAVK